MSVDNMTELRKRIPGGKYALTRAIAERAKQLQNGALPLTEVRVPNPISVAIDEVLQGKVNFEFKTAEQVEIEAEAAVKAEEKAAAAAVRAEARAEAKAAAEAEAANEEAAGDETEDELAVAEEAATEES